MNGLKEICEKLEEVERWLQIQQSLDDGLQVTYSQMWGTIMSIRMRLLSGITKGEPINEKTT